MIEIDEHRSESREASRSTRTDPAMLVESGELARLAADHSPDVSCVVDPDGVFRYVGGCVDQLIGMEPTDAVGMLVWEFIHPDDLDSAAGAFNEATRGIGYHLPTVFRVRRRSGDWVDCEMKGTTFEGEGGTWMILSVRGIQGRDEVMERRRSIEQLIRRASMECSALSWCDVADVVNTYLGDMAEIVNARSITIGWEDDGEMVVGAGWPECSPAAPGIPFEPLWPISETVNSLLRFSSDLESEPESPTLNMMMAGGVAAVVEVPLSASRPWEVARFTFGQQWSHWDDVNVDLTKVLLSTLTSTLRRCNAERSLQHQASTDPLTGLMNRSELYRVLDEFLEDRRGSGNVAVLYADLDYFKQVNDLHGHSAGDELLYQVGMSLRSSVRAVDVLARVGGDEFVIVCPDIEADEQVSKIIRRIESSVESLARPDRPVAISVGRAMGQPGLSGDELVRLADEDMYRVKRTQTRRGDHIALSRLSTPPSCRPVLRSGKVGDGVVEDAE